jgi:hypothetical protein
VLIAAIEAIEARQTNTSTRVSNACIGIDIASEQQNFVAVVEGRGRVVYYWQYVRVCADASEKNIIILQERAQSQKQHFYQYSRFKGYEQERFSL